MSYSVLGLKIHLQRLFRSLGYEVRRGGFADSRHGNIYTTSTYSPWNVDADFRAAHAKVSHATLVDKLRLYELWTLVEEAGKLAAGAIVEVGCWRGGSGLLLAERARTLRIPEPVYLCDTFRGVVKAGENDNSYRGGELADASKADVEALASRLGLDNVRVLEGVFPEESGARLDCARVRLCHIDVDTYGSAKDAVAYLWDRIVPGGLCVFDDFGSHECDGIVRFVEEQRALRDRFVLYNLNGHAIVFKLGE